MKFGVGQAIPRIEDHRLVTGKGQYTDDIDPGTGLRFRVSKTAVW